MSLFLQWVEKNNVDWHEVYATIHYAVIRQSRSSDVTKQQEAILPRRYVSGETQFYLGRRYVLKVLVDAAQLTSVKLSRGRLNVTLKRDIRPNTKPNTKPNTRSNIHDRAHAVKALIEQWYQNKAKAVFHERLAELLPKTTWVTGIPSFRVMTMTKQWGSCSAKGNLMLNPHLVKAPKECIDYVILHELCHIAEHNHSERFWRLLTQVMPNWKTVKAKLDDMAEMYLNE